MALITKPDMEFIWASGGAIVEPSDVKKQLGWTPEVPPHQWENWIQNRQDQYIAHVNQRGIPEWDGNTEYEAGGLSYVQGSDGIVYKSVAASGPSTTTQNPTTDATDTYWTVAFADVGAFLTEAAGDIRYAQRANNLSDLANLSTARTNLGVANAVAAGISGSHSNLRISATGTNATVTITADSICVKDSANNQAVLNSVSVTPSLSGSGVNGLDTGVSAANTWYYAWVIWDGTTTAGLLSLSATSPTLPVGYTHKARVGTARSDGTGNKYPFAFTQYGRRVRYAPAAGSNLTALRQMASGVAGNVNTPTFVAVAWANFVPPTAGSITVVLGSGSNASGTGLVAANTTYGAANSTTNPAPIALINSSGSVVTGDVPLETANIQWASSTTTATLNCFGYEDNL